MYVDENQIAHVCVNHHTLRRNSKRTFAFCTHVGDDRISDVCLNHMHHASMLIIHPLTPLCSMRLACLAFSSSATFFKITGIISRTFAANLWCSNAQLAAKALSAASRLCLLASSLASVALFAPCDASAATATAAVVSSSRARNAASASASALTLPACLGRIGLSTRGEITGPGLKSTYLT